MLHNVTIQRYMKTVVFMIILIKRYI